MEPVRLYTVRETCKILRISKPTLYRLFNSGKLSHLKIGRKPLVRESEIHRFLDASKSPA